MTRKDGTEKILSPLQFLLQNDKDPLKNTLDDTIRNIPVNQWATCLYSNKKKTTLKVTLSFSGKRCCFFSF